MRWEDQGRTAGPAAKALLVLGWYALLLLAFLAWIGWFGGPLCTWVRPAGTPRATMLFFSSDMGFKVGMGPRLASRLARRGIAVLGVNSVVYFRRQRTAEEATRLLREAMAEADRATPGRPLVLAGQSFGADALQVALAGLPEAERRKVALVMLIVPDARVQLRLSPGGAWPVAAPEFDGAATARKLGWAPLLCIEGRDQTDSLCPALRMPNVRRVALPGGHQLRRDANRLAGIAGDAVLAATAARPASAHPRYPG